MTDPPRSNDRDETTMSVSNEQLARNLEQIKLMLVPLIPKLESTLHYLEGELAIRKQDRNK
jgi:hypothetical protein